MKDEVVVSERRWQRKAHVKPSMLLHTLPDRDGSARALRGIAREPQTPAEEIAHVDQSTLWSRSREAHVVLTCGHVDHVERFGIAVLEPCEVSEIVAGHAATLSAER